MKNREKKENVFDEIDKEMEQFNREHEKLDKEKKRLEISVEQLKKEYTEIKRRIKQQRMLNKCMKTFTACIVLLLVLLTSLICLSMFKGQYGKAIYWGTLFLFLAVFNLVFFKKIFNINLQKEIKDE